MIYAPELMTDAVRAVRGEVETASPLRRRAALRTALRARRSR
jgi:hypothetical protein